MGVRVIVSWLLKWRKVPLNEIHAPLAINGPYFSTTQLREQSRVSILVCDWLSPTFPSSHWSIESQSAGVGDRNSSGSSALVPSPHSSPLPAATQYTPPPFPQLWAPSQDNRQRGVTGYWGDSMKYLKQVRSKCGERGSLWKCCITSSSNTQLWCQCRVEIKSCGWLFYIWYLRVFLIPWNTLRYIFWGKITSSDYLSQYSVSVSF